MVPSRRVTRSGGAPLNRLMIPTNSSFFCAEVAPLRGEGRTRHGREGVSCRRSSEINRWLTAFPARLGG